MANTRLSTRADEIMDAAIQALVDEGLDVPDYRFVSDGEVAWDCCSALMVQPGPLVMGYPGASNSSAPNVSAGLQWFQEFYVWLTRESAPSSDAQPESEAILDARGREFLEEGGALFFGIMRAWRESVIGSTCTLIATSMEPRGPEGGTTAWRVTVAVEV